jgi:hypothetical protein
MLEDYTFFVPVSLSEKSGSKIRFATGTNLKWIITANYDDKKKTMVTLDVTAS